MINLCFHGIGACRVEREPGEARYWVSVDFFRRVLDEVRRLPQVKISFDDGNRSDRTIAMPALQERGLNATFFALAGRLEDPASLSSSDLVELRAAGMGVGSHGWAHVPWRGLGTQTAQRELAEAREVLAEASGGPIDDAALPLGRYDRQLLAQLRARGYRNVFTSDRFPSRPGAWLQARYSVRADDTLESVRRVIVKHPSLEDGRNALVSLVKRLR